MQKLSVNSEKLPTNLFRNLKMFNNKIFLNECLKLIWTGRSSQTDSEKVVENVQEFCVYSKNEL